MEPRISIIVPIYKVEAYLHQCVDSILAQTYSNLEIILVDDGSPDYCGVICDEYAKQDSRIRVIHKINGGLSDARNAGMEVATGDYLMFVDSDDLISRTSVEILLNIALEKNADLVIGNHIRFYEKPDDQNISSDQNIQCMSSESAMEDMLRNGCASWARLYKREVHQDILFPVGEINEDEAIVLHLLSKCKVIVKTSDVVYFYRCRPESITTASFSPKKMDWYYHCVSNLSWLQTEHPKLVPLAASRLGNCIVFLLHEIATEGYSEDILSSILLKDLRGNYSFYRDNYFFGKKEKIRMWILKYLPYCVYRFLITLNKMILNR